MTDPFKLPESTVKPPFPDWSVPPQIGQVDPNLLAAIQQWLLLNPTLITQTPGFSMFTAQTAPTINATETTTSTTYTDLATVGPSLSSLGDGRYVVLFGAFASISDSAETATMAVSDNGNTPGANDAAITKTTQAVSISRAVSVTLTSGSNTLVGKYASSGVATASFAYRWMIALRYSS